MRACVVLSLNGFGFANLILICGWLLLADGAHMYVIASVVVAYIGIE